MDYDSGLLVHSVPIAESVQQFLPNIYETEEQLMSGRQLRGEKVSIGRPSIELPNAAQSSTNQTLPFADGNGKSKADAPTLTPSDLTPNID